MNNKTEWDEIPRYKLKEAITIGKSVSNLEAAIDNFSFNYYENQPNQPLSKLTSEQRNAANQLFSAINYYKIEIEHHPELKENSYLNTLIEKAEGCLKKSRMGFF